MSLSQTCYFITSTYPTCADVFSPLVTRHRQAQWTYVSSDSSATTVPLFICNIFYNVQYVNTIRPSRRSIVSSAGLAPSVVCWSRHHCFFQSPIRQRQQWQQLLASLSWHCRLVGLECGFTGPTHTRLPRPASG